MKNTQKGFAPLAIVAVIALALIGGGVYMYAQKGGKMSVSTTATGSLKFLTPQESDNLTRGSSFNVVWEGSYPKTVTLKIESTPRGSTFSSAIGDYSGQADRAVWAIPCDLDSSQGWYRLALSDKDTGTLIATSSAFGFRLEKSASCTAPANSSVSNEQTPYIGSITPQSARKGDTVEIRGSALNGFEGDVYFFFKRADGKEVRLPGVLSQQMSGDAKGAQTARVVLKEPCQAGQTVYGDYSGKPSQCDYVALDAGTYSVYTAPWGKKSNAVSFSIVK